VQVAVSLLRLDAELHWSSVMDLVHAAVATPVVMVSNFPILTGDPCATWTSADVHGHV